MALITKYGIVLVYRDDTGCPPYIEIFMFHFIFKSDPIFDTSDYFVSSQRACIQQIACIAYLFKKLFNFLLVVVVVVVVQFQQAYQVRYRDQTLHKDWNL